MLALIIGVGWLIQFSWNSAGRVASPEPTEPARSMRSTLPDKPAGASAPEFTINPSSTPTASAVSSSAEEDIGARLNQWLTSSSDLKKVAETILNNFSSVKPEDQARVVHALIPLVSDENYAPLGNLMLDPRLSFNAHRMLFLNLKLRSDQVELPFLLQLMRQREAHPFAEDARIELHIRFGEDYGTDWNRWNRRIAEELSTR